MRTSLFILLFMSMLSWGNAQITPGVYFASSDKVTYELKVSDDYLVLTSYEAKPAKFLQTIGGFYSIQDDEIAVDLEFNSNYESDSIKHIDIPFQAKEGIIIFRMQPKLVFNKTEENEQELEGFWLFGTRGPDTGQERRTDENPRKTLKILMGDRFQWIAYHTETMKFSGTGGGSFSSEDGRYVEEIEYFSRDDSRVGAKLKFDFNLIDNDWHHTGNNSRGEPMYEIWARR